jgi:hypothetical protein
MTSLRYALPFIGTLVCAAVQAEVPSYPHRVAGKFDVAITPAAPPLHEGSTAMARMLLDKQYFGELQAVGKGEMLSARTDTPGSAAYVAIERVTGTLNGRQGSFVIQHAGTMSGGASQLTIGIVPDSGTGELAGISGRMAIKQTGRQHFYEMDYILP